MRRDQEYYSAYEPGVDLPLLRFYTWSEPCLSLGRFETLTPESEARLQALKLGWVRRPTGGSAILHGGDLTFSLVGPSDWLAGSLLAGHAQMTLALSRGLAQLGIQADAGSEPAQKAPGHCFAVSTPADLRVKGQKLVGTAQVRRRKAFLLQGMLYLQADQSLFRQVFSEQAPLTDLSELMDSQPDPERVISALTAGFSAAFGLTFAARESGDDGLFEPRCAR